MADVLSIAKSGLFAAKKSLETTGHNISNANTEGYSRQKVNQTSNVPIVKGGHVEGTGARIINITRVHDPFIEERYNHHVSSLEYSKERAGQLEKIEFLFNEADSEGLTYLLNRFYNSFKELANQPENDAIRAIVRQNAQLVIKDFHRMRSSLDGLARNIDLMWEKSSSDINNILDHIAILNKEIVRLEVMGGESADLRDQRDQAVKTLSKFFDLKTYLDQNNNYIVSARGVGTVVSGDKTVPFITASASSKDSSNMMEGSADIYYKHRPYNPITSRFQKGSLAATATIKNVDISKLQEEIDILAFEFVKSVNALHRRGFVHRTVETDEQGNPVSHDHLGQTSGINLFKEPAEVYNAAQLIDLSDEVRSDLTNLTAALLPNSPGDNRVALAISKLQDEKILHNGTKTLQEHYLQMIGKIGLETGKAHLDTEQAEGILAQTSALKERISGVSLDEEAANMMRYQHAYDAAAKVLKVSEEMFQSLINIKR